MEATTQNIAKIHQALDEIRPFLNNDGGDITFIELTAEGIVKVKLHGACIGCSVNQMTLKTGVEMTIKKYLPNITAVVQVQ
jgi:Fe-S cluster biogenesis protein NfuA